MKSTFTNIAICLARLLSRLPFSRAQRLGALVGRLIVPHNQRTTKAINRNLELCFPGISKEDSKHLLTERCKKIGQTLFEMSHLWVKDPDVLVSYLQPNPANQVFEEALRGDQGIIILAPHLGNWEMLNYYLSQFRTLTVMYRPNDNEHLDRFIRESRERVGSELAPTNRQGVMQLMKALKRGGLVGILPDQVPQEGSGVYAPFYGHQAYTMTLATQLAVKTNARVFIGAAFQVEGGYQVHVNELESGFYSKDSQQSATIMNAAIESIIALHPEQYQWEYKRFKKQPDGNPSLYKKG